MRQRFEKVEYPYKNSCVVKRDTNGYSESNEESIVQISISYKRFPSQASYTGQS